MHDDRILASAVCSLWQDIKDQHPRYSESKAWELADKVRKLMDEYGYSEDNAVDMVIERRQAI